jgi:hypothetical protein
LSPFSFSDFSAIFTIFFNALDVSFDSTLISSSVDYNLEFLDSLILFDVDFSMAFTADLAAAF